MKYIVKFENEVIGSVTTNHSMTDEEICEMAGVALAITQEDFEGMPENGKYDLDELEIIEEAEQGAKDYAGARWGDLTEAEQKKLLKNANAVDGDGNEMHSDGECIFDLLHPYSVAGRVQDGEIIIDDGAVIYNPVVE